MGKMRLDEFINVAYAYVVQSAINTLTFAQIRMATGIFQGVAMVLHRVKYRPSTRTVRELVAVTDSWQFALTTSNRLVDIADVSEPAVIDVVQRTCVGVPVADMDLPIVSDFTSLPSMGKIIPCNPLFVGIQTAGYATPGSLFIELEFTFKELADKDYIELIQSQLPANI